jgi:hypothetical protein
LELLSILSDRAVVKQSETGSKERAPEDRSQYKGILKGEILEFIRKESGKINDAIANY